MESLSLVNIKYYISTDNLLNIQGRKKNKDMKDEKSNDSIDIILVAIYILTFIFCLLSGITIFNSSVAVAAIETLVLIILLLVIRYIIQK